MTDILTITLNPALDISTAVDEMLPEAKLRCAAPTYDPGGGGVNVSRTVQKLGGVSRAFVALGGATGQRVQDLVKAEGVATLPYPAPAETRICLAITDRSTGAQFRPVLPGPVWKEVQAQALLQTIAGHARPNGLVVLSGSNPPGLPADFARQLRSALTKIGAGLIADTSGPALAALAQRPDTPLHSLRMDRHEAETLAGHPLPTTHDSANFAAQLVNSGVAGCVLVARGRRGRFWPHLTGVGAPSRPRFR